MRFVVPCLSLLGFFSTAGAFVVPSAVKAQEQARSAFVPSLESPLNNVAAPCLSTPSNSERRPLLAVKKSKDEKKDDGPSPELILRWIGPTNPYMWFVYMFAFIIGADAVKHL